MNHFWTDEDFHVFDVPGLDERMDELKRRIRPKFEELGQIYSSYLSEVDGQEFFAHIAKHARRTVNPPQDSWVAFAANKRGYKAHPHFQIGLWGSHIFVILAVIYEAAEKTRMASDLLETREVHELPEDFVLSGDHTKPEAGRMDDMTSEDVTGLLIRLRDVKKGELVIGRHLSRADAVTMSKEEFRAFTENTFDQLLPIYKTLTHGPKISQ
ncbi:YktB family protein [Planococcus lenghuensis]|uniref:UPF0637 protein B0X71_12580 n=1 Tax=Planococcus lenghuensis TaxID=2213202 RepID=A0A1Q2L083_9BACL|nr:DUF1054 domain-containing protein [Planococcus lenghuensis]AQQ53841.1 hypothetical protein B0X71_12580 [Planococcus lenghuensis]